MPAPEPASEELTYEDYCEIPEDGLRQVVLAGNLHRFDRRGLERPPDPVAGKRRPGKHVSLF